RARRGAPIVPRGATRRGLLRRLLGLRVSPPRAGRASLRGRLRTHLLGDGGRLYRRARPDPLAADAVGILKHMNEDHADALIAYATGLSGTADVSAVTMTGVDRYGFEMAVTTPSGPRATRIGFDEPVDGSEAVRKAMVALVKRARAAG